MNKGKGVTKQSAVCNTLFISETVYVIENKPDIEVYPL
jgi:hypothetical protein